MCTKRPLRAAFSSTGSVRRSWEHVFRSARNRGDSRLWRALLSKPVRLRPEVVYLQHMYQLAEASPTAPVPPQNLDAEESVLGAMMLSPGAIGAVSEVLSASDFYRASHGVVYKAALDLYAKGEPVDAITLCDELERRGELEEIGGRKRNKTQEARRARGAKTARRAAESQR